MDKNSKDVLMEKLYTL